MSRIRSTWPVLLFFSVEDTDREPDGALTDSAIERLWDAARDAYFSGCRTVDVRACDLGTVAIQRGPATIGAQVSVSAAVIEVFPEGFTMAGRVRGDNDEIAADTRCFVAPAGGVAEPVRDELIARAHAAKRFH